MFKQDGLPLYSFLPAAHASIHSYVPDIVLKLRTEDKKTILAFKGLAD